LINWLRLGVRGGKLLFRPKIIVAPGFLYPQVGARLEVLGGEHIGRIERRALAAAIHNGDVSPRVIAVD
jgi:hypothetical protein